MEAMSRTRNPMSFAPTAVYPVRLKKASANASPGRDLVNSPITISTVMTSM
jgi:hypothetical protein